MKYLMMIMGCLLIAALLAPLCTVMVRGGMNWNKSLRSFKRALGLHAGQVRCNAFGDGIHADGVITLRADEVHAYRHLMVTRGSDADHIAPCDADELPLGLCGDTPSAIEDPANVHLLGRGAGTRLAVGSGAIAADVNVFTDDAGELQEEPETAGTYYLVGKSVTACAGAHKEFELAPCAPIKLVVVAAMGSTNGTAAGAADLAALKTEMELATDDLRRIAAAMSEAALVKVLTA